MYSVHKFLKQTCTKNLHCLTYQQPTNIPPTTYHMHHPTDALPILIWGSCCLLLPIIIMWIFHTFVAIFLQQEMQNKVFCLLLLCLFVRLGKWKYVVSRNKIIKHELVGIIINYFRDMNIYCHLQTVVIFIAIAIIIIIIITMTVIVINTITITIFITTTIITTTNLCKWTRFCARYIRKSSLLWLLLCPSWIINEFQRIEIISLDIW